MLPHLRSQHRAIEKGVKDINDFLKKVGSGAQLDETGRCRLQYQNVGVHVVVMPTNNLIVFKSFTNYLPDPSTGKVLPLYYHLLDMNDEPSTGLAYFSIIAGEQVGAEHDVISVECKRLIADISYTEFEASLKAVGDVANAFMERLEQEFEAPRVL